MSEFLQGSLFFSWELFKFMIFFYVVWAPGFLISAMISCRYRRSAWNSVVGQSKEGFKGVSQAMGLGIVGTGGRKASLNATLDLLNDGVSPVRAFACFIASRNMTIHFWSIFALSLGAEFATGQILGTLVMIGFAALTLPHLRLRLTNGNSDVAHYNGVIVPPEFASWSGLLFTLRGWQAIFKFSGREILRFAPSLFVGILLGGIIFAAGLKSRWPRFADLFGHATLISDLTNALVAPFLSSIASLSPVGNLPVIHALFKTDGLSYAGIISFCLASAIHPNDIKTYSRVFGPRKTVVLIGLLYGAAVIGGLGSTWVYATFGFRPSLPPVKLASKIFETLLYHLRF